jgi:hypothetical protein
VLASLVLASGTFAVGHWPGDVLQPWSKASKSGGFVLEVDPEDRDGLGAAQTTLSDASGSVLWSKRVEYSLREAEITPRGEVVGWAAREHEARPQMSIVVLDPRGEPRSVEWPADSAAGVVKGIVLVPDADRAVLRLYRAGGDTLTNEREEWLVLKLSTGERVSRFIPPVLQREGLGVLGRMIRVAGRPLLCCEAWFGGSGEVLVELLDLDGRSVWSQAIEEHRPRGIDLQSWAAWASSPARLSSRADGELQFQRFSPEELVSWRVSGHPDASGDWSVAEESRAPHASGFVLQPDGIGAEPLSPRILAEHQLGEPAQGISCTEAHWTDAALDAHDLLLVLEPQQRHMHIFDGSGAPLPVVTLEDAGLTVHRIFCVRERGFDLSVGDSFATWSRKGERLTTAYGNYHRAFPNPLRNAREGSRWFHDEHAVLRFVDDDPTKDVAQRVLRRPDRTWFEEIQAGSVAPDGGLSVADCDEAWPIPLRPPTPTTTHLSQFDATGKARNGMRLRLRLDASSSLTSNGRWLAGYACNPDSGFLLDLEKQRLFVLEKPFAGSLLQVLLPQAPGEFWIVDRAGKRLVRAALPGD